MEELTIAIDCYKSKKHTLELEITGPTQYGKWPNDKEFELILAKSTELKAVKEKISMLEELKEDIESNDRVTYSRSIASGEYCLCPICGEESSNFEEDED